MTLMNDETGIEPDNQENLGEFGAPDRRVMPELCRVSIQTTRTQVDLALPRTVALSMMVPSILDTIDEHTGKPEITSPDDYAESLWHLSRPGSPPLSLSKSLDDLGIDDGELLLLHRDSASAPAPLFDDIFIAVSATGNARTKQWSPLAARVVGSVASVLAAILGCIALINDGAAQAGFGQPGLAIALMIGCVTAAVLVARIYHDQLAAIILSLCSLPFAATAGLLLVPGKLSAPHLMLGLMFVMTISIIALRATGTGATVLIAITTASILGFISSFVAVVTEQPTHTVGAGLAGLSLAALAIAPRLAMLLARLPLPPVPSPGNKVDLSPEGIDAADFAQSGHSGHDLETAALPSIADLEDRASNAHSMLTGTVCGTVVATVAGAALAAQSLSPSSATDMRWWAGFSLASVVTLVLLLRSRTHSDLVQAVALNAGGLVLALVIFANLVLRFPDYSLILCTVTALATTTALVLGFIVAATTYSPVLRRTVEVIEYIAIAAVLPLVCWVCGIYGAVRGI
ncbi:MAG: type VII secretion integral membrane protein EccD [Mycobacteriaceae bacterium]